MRIAPIATSPLRAALACAAIAATLASAPVRAQEPGSRQTREFVQAAAQTDQFEIMEATSALAESTDPRVRAFAQEMIQAHRQTTSTLLQAVAKAGLKPPSPGISGDQSMFLAALQSQRGADFDRTYIKQQAMVHHAALAVMQGYAASGDEAAIRQAATAIEAVVMSHLRMAEQIEGATGGA